jgi:hypothetical protein
VSQKKTLGEILGELQFTSDEQALYRNIRAKMMEIHRHKDESDDKIDKAKLEIRRIIDEGIRS